MDQMPSFDRITQEPGKPRRSRPHWTLLCDRVDAAVECGDEVLRCRRNAEPRRGHAGEQLPRCLAPERPYLEEQSVGIFHEANGAGKLRHGGQPTPLGQLPPDLDKGRSPAHQFTIGPPNMKPSNGGLRHQARPEFICAHLGDIEPTDAIATRTALIRRDFGPAHGAAAVKVDAELAWGGVEFGCTHN